MSTHLATPGHLEASVGGVSWRPQRAAVAAVNLAVVFEYLSRWCWLCCRVPEECPAWVAELINACMSEEPAARPTSKAIYQMLLANGASEGSNEAGAMSA